MPSRLPADRCLELLEGAVAGHLSLSWRSLPLTIPTTCGLSDKYLVVRFGSHWLGSAPPEMGIVAFQTAASGMSHSLRWEVQVQGHGAVVTEGPELDVPPALLLIANKYTTVVRISMELIAGWEYSSRPGPSGPGGLA
ncbi:MAG TPA: hypothetical protein VME46_23355 [Acidimicrobiales bacterium]|nr:hypothetical protein [Acidimicrobiales bacterium]